MGILHQDPPDVIYGAEDLLGLMHRKEDIAESRKEEVSGAAKGSAVTGSQGGRETSVYQKVYT